MEAPERGLLSCRRWVPLTLNEGLRGVRKLARRTRHLSEQSAITLFLEACQSSKALLPLDDSDRGALLQVIAKCGNRLKEIEKEKRIAIAKAEDWRKKYEAYSQAQVQAGHKVSGYSTWVKIAHGSYGQTKK